MFFGGAFVALMMLASCLLCLFEYVAYFCLSFITARSTWIDEFILDISDSPPLLKVDMSFVLSIRQITHEISLDDEIDPQTALDVFKVDPDYTENEAKYEAIKKELLGIESGDEGGDEADEGEEVSAAEVPSTWATS